MTTCPARVVGSCVYLTDAHRVRRLEYYHLERQQHRDPVDGADDGGLGALPEVPRAPAPPPSERDHRLLSLARSGDASEAERQERARFCKDRLSLNHGED